MNNKEQFDFYVKNGIMKQEQDINRVELLANKLIESLYKPTTKEGLFNPDWVRIKKEHIDNTEPINWGDLKTDVEKKGELYFITIDEASPGECLTLCYFIEKYLTAWGWPVIVATEW
jgi:hypothetical protein